MKRSFLTAAGFAIFVATMLAGGAYAVWWGHNVRMPQLAAAEKADREKWISGCHTMGGSAILTVSGRYDGCILPPKGAKR